jgi:hypothetical protein
MAAAKPRKRIVAQLVQSSPLGADFAEPADSDRTGPLHSLPTPQLDQQQQSEWARAQLGAERKVFVTLTTTSYTIDWEQVR